MSDQDPRIAGLRRLREPFPQEHVGLLPRITCGACRDARGKCCDKHSKTKCDACGNWITTQHMHIDYVGHGAVTDRLLEVDPEWTWEPVGRDDNGRPLFDRDGRGNPVALWIRLTVLGVTREGVGTVDSGAVDAEKQLIGDALRNAAMRFGVALDLWIKGQAGEGEGGRDAEPDRQPRRSAQSRSRDAHPSNRRQPQPDPSGPGVHVDVVSLRARMAERVEKLAPSYQEALRVWWKEAGLSWSGLTAAQADTYEAKVAHYEQQQATIEAEQGPCGHCQSDPCECGPADDPDNYGPADGEA